MPGHYRRRSARLRKQDRQARLDLVLAAPTGEEQVRAAFNCWRIAAWHHPDRGTVIHEAASWLYQRAVELEAEVELAASAGDRR